MSTPPGGNPLASLNEVELWNATLELDLVCGRNTSSLTKKRRQYACLLRQSLKIEADLRGLPAPEPPFGVGDFKHNVPGAL